MNIVEAILLNECLSETQKKYSRVLKRYLRDSTNPFDTSDLNFIANYRLPKCLVVELFKELNDKIYESRYSNGIPIEIKVLSALRFYATGSYQRSVGNDALISLSQTCISNNILEVSLAINKLVTKYIKFPKTTDECMKIKEK